MSRKLVTCLALLAFLIFLVARLPLGLIAGGSLPAGAHASGSVWQGAIDGLVVPGAPGARLKVYGRALALFGLGLSADVRMEGLQFQGRGTLSTSVLSPRSLTDGAFNFDLTALALPVPVIGHIRGRNISVTLTAEGSCISASGTLTSDAVQRTGVRYSWAGPLLEGPLTCVNGVLVATLVGVSDGTQVALELSGDRNTQRAELSFDNAPAILSFALEGAGFRRKGDNQLSFSVTSP